MIKAREYNSSPATSTPTGLLITQLENQNKLTTISTWVDSHSSTWSLTDEALADDVYGRGAKKAPSIYSHAAHCVSVVRP